MAKKPANQDANPNAGHRARLRDRFLSSGAAALADYELLELLLFGAMPRADTKPLAKRLLKEFGSLDGVLNAAPEKLRLAFPNSPSLLATLRLASVLTERVARARVVGKPVFHRVEPCPRLLPADHGPPAA